MKVRGPEFDQATHDYEQRKRLPLLYGAHVARRRVARDVASRSRLSGTPGSRVHFGYWGATEQKTRGSCAGRDRQCDLRGRRRAERALLHIDRRNGGRSSIERSVDVRAFSAFREGHLDGERLRLGVH